MIACNKFYHLVGVSPTKKNLGAQIWAELAKIGPKIRFFAIFSSLDLEFSFKLHRMIPWNNLELLANVKRPKKILGPKIEPDIALFAIFSSLRR